MPNGTCVNQSPPNHRLLILLIKEKSYQPSGTDSSLQKILMEVCEK